jgi:hypothetical protein
VLLVVLWVRSYSSSDWIERLDKAKLQTSIGSSAGTLICSQVDWASQPGGVVAPYNWRYTATKPFFPTKSHWVDWSNRPGVFRVAISHWLLIPLVAALAAATWLRWRFSLRSLLIATTLVAVGLGLIVWMTRAG